MDLFILIRQSSSANLLSIIVQILVIGERMWHIREFCDLRVRGSFMESSNPLQLRTKHRIYDQLEAMIMSLMSIQLRCQA